MFESYKLNIPVLDSPCPVPDVHYAKHTSSHDESCVTTMWEFVNIGNKEGTFHCKVNCEEQIDQRRRNSFDHHIVRKQNGRHEHRHYYRESICSFHSI